MEQTPVEWLISVLISNPLPKSNSEFMNGDWADILKKARKMDKERLESLKDFDTWKEWKNSK